MTREPAVDAKGQLRVEAKEAIFFPEQIPGWENKVDYTIRCHGKLAQLLDHTLAVSDVLVISGGERSIFDINNWKKTFLDLTGDNVHSPVTILRLPHAVIQI